MVPWMLCAGLIAVVLLLTAKILLLQKSMDEICAQFRQCLCSDTNTLISLPSRDRHARALASEINVQLRLLRGERTRFQTGDRELKQAVTNISHDLRTPLTAICGYLDLLDKEEKSEEAARCLAIIKNRTDALKHLTEELFRYSVLTLPPEDAPCERVSLNGALEESLSSYYAALKKRGIHPRISMPEETVWRFLDKNALSRVLGNLLSNAVKYSDGDLEVTLSPAGEITFSNTAAGLDEIQLAKLFDRFYTLESARKSTGLGLSIAKLLMEQMHGSIRAEYREQKLCLRLTFPKQAWETHR